MAPPTGHQLSLYGSSIMTSCFGEIWFTKVFTVKPGTFQRLRQFAIETTSASANQYKIPRVVRTKEAADFIMKNVIQ